MERITAGGRREFLSAERFAELLLKAGELAANDHSAHKLRRYGRLMHREKILLAAGQIGLQLAWQESLLRDVSTHGIGLLHRLSMPRHSYFRVKLPRGNEMVEMLYTVTNCVAVSRSLYRVGAEMICIAPHEIITVDDEAVRKVREAMFG